MEETSSRECALIAARAADERKATDIMVIKVGDLVDVTDYFVIATGANTPQVRPSSTTSRKKCVSRAA